MAQIRKGTTYATGDQITATNINALVDNAILLNGAITDQTTGTVLQTDNLLLAGNSDLKKATVASLLTGLVKADGTVPMTADLQLVSSTPSVALSAASKGYVDSRTAFTPVQQGGGTGQGSNKIYIGWLGSNLGLGVDNTNFAATWPIGISGNAATATNATTAAACSGNSATATLASTATNALACSGNAATATNATNATTAATATNALACSGNAATATLATTATNALACSGNAATATLATTATTAVNGVPAGAIIAWPSAIVPSGWLECNGQSTSGYTALAAVVGATVPDLRGEFIRGWDHSKGTDPARAINTSQADAIQNITGKFAIGGTEQQVYGPTGPFYDTGERGGAYGTGHDNNPSNPYVGFDASRQVRTSTETRPRNIALMYIIKT